MTSWKILEGDCRDVLATLDAGSAQTCVTSPPYFGLRDYGHGGQIGLEPSPDEFVQALVGVFREVRRVLRDDGTVWLNLGDSYASSPSGQNGLGASSLGSAKGEASRAAAVRFAEDSGQVARRPTPIGWKPKDLIGVPWMVAFALRADGWYLRSDIIWAKPNPMPESVTDRPTKSHEYVFLLSKGPRYFYDADAIREPHAEPGRVQVNGGGAYEEFGRDRQKKAFAAGDDRGYNPAGRNKRSVWTVATQPYAGVHFATFPPKLIEPCVLAGCPERACAGCGAPWQRVVEREPRPAVERTSDRVTVSDAEHGTRLVGGAYQSWLDAHPPRTVGFEPSCGCEAGTTAGTVLDPFSGAGTTGMVALRHGRSYIGVELNPEYAQMSRYRIVDDAPLLNSVAEVAA